MPECPNCHLSASSDARFCAACGTRLGGGDEAAEGPTLTRPREPIGGDDPTDPNMRAVDPTLPFGPDLVTCPECGAPNVPQRRRCGRCGKELREGGAPAPEPAGPAPATAGSARAPAPATEPVHVPERDEDVTPSDRPAGRSDRPSGREAVNPPVRTSPRFEEILSEDSTEFEEPARQRRHWLVATVIVGGVALGTLLGVLLVAGIGPFGDGAETFEFDTTRYQDAAVSLVPTRVGASSVLPGDALNSYGPSLLVDEDRTTAWRSLPDAGGSIVLDLDYERPVWVTEIAVASGDQASADTFATLGRPTRLLVTFDGTRTVRLALQDVPGVQRVVLDAPRLAAKIRFEIEERVGDDEVGVAISELRLTGFRADERDASAWRQAYG